MKRSLLAFGAAAIVLAGCSNKSNFDMTVTLPTSEFKGQTLVLHSLMNDDTLATATIGDSTVTLSGKVDKPVLAALSANGLPLGTLVVEKGSIKWNEDSITGTPCNDEFNQLQKQLMAGNGDDAEKIANDFVKKYPANPYSYALVADLGGMFTEETLNAFIKTNPDLAQDPAVKAAMTYVKTRAATSGGSSYIDFSGENTNGQKVSLSSLMTGAKYTIVDFWAPWCGPCCREIPNLEKIYKVFKNKGLQIVGAEVWRKEGAPAASEKAKELGVTYPIIYNVGKDVTEQYGIYGIPTIIIIDDKGKIVGRDLMGDDLAKFVAGLFK